MARTASNETTVVVSVLEARSKLGKLLNHVEEKRVSLLIEKRGALRGVLLSLQDYVKLAAPEPEILRLIGEDSTRKRTNALSSRQIDAAIRAARAQKKRQ